MKLSKVLLLSILLLSFLLNFYKLDQIPPGLYMDEASIGVNSYSILTTGQDEHGVKLPLYFQAFGEYKLPVYIYLTSASMFLFGKNEFAVRFPSAFLGSLTPLIFYFLVKELTKKEKLSLLSTFLFAFNPWFLHFAGPAFEATLGLFFFVMASLLALYYLRYNRLSFLILSLSSFVLTVYTYQSFRIITPLTLFLILWQTFKPRKNWLPLFLIFIFFLPIVYSLTNSELNTRFFQTTAFSQNQIMTPFIFLNNYLSYFSFDFLFNKGDGIGRHQIPNLGLFFKWQVPFLLVGFYCLFKTIKLFSSKIILFFLLLFPIPAALTIPSPHTLRSLPMVIPYTILITLGIRAFFHKSKKLIPIFLVIVTIIFSCEFSYYLHYNFFHYPKTNQMDWGGNYKQLVKTVAKYKDKYDSIVLDNNLAQAYIYFRFYDEKLKTVSVDSSWNKRDYEVNKPILFITKYLDEKTGKPSEKLLETIYLTNDNQDGFAQIWEI